MKECHKLILQRLVLELVKNLEPEPLLLYLYQKQIIDEDDKDEIRRWNVRKDVEPRYNDPRYNDVPGVTMNILCPGKSYSKMYWTEPIMYMYIIHPRCKRKLCNVSMVLFHWQ